MLHSDRLGVRARSHVGRAKRRILGFLQARGAGRECPLCGWTGGKFLAFGRRPYVQLNAQCPDCGSLERDRLAYILLKDRLGTGQMTLHSSPEPALQCWLKSISTSYLSIDLEGARAMRAMDLTALPLPDESYTLVYCSNVLEHIPDDARAIGEMRRVLKPGAHAVIIVPVQGETTDEDLAVTDPRERHARYGQSDHVRFYGLDIIHRLNASGFRVTRLDGTELDDGLVERHGLPRSGSRAAMQKMFMCEAV
jgi:SAM-dependent methyltransferase